MDGRKHSLMGCSCYFEEIMNEEYNIVEHINERLGVCDYKGLKLVVEYKRIQEEGVDYVEGLYQLQNKFSERREQARIEEETRRKFMTLEQIKAREDAQRIFQDRMNEEAVTNAKLS